MHPGKKCRTKRIHLRECCVARRPEPNGVRPLGETKHMSVGCEWGVFVRRLGCYGETAACWMLHPNRLRYSTHPGLSCASYHPRSGQWLPEVSRKGTSASELRSAARNPPVYRFHQTRRRIRTAAALYENVCAQLLQHAHAIYMSAPYGALGVQQRCLSQQLIYNLFSMH